MNLTWQSKLVLLLALPFAAAEVVLEGHWWAVNSWPVAAWTLGLSALFGLGVLGLGAGTPGAAFCGATITAGLMFSTMRFVPDAAYAYAPWHTALLPVLGVFLLAHLATRLGWEDKQRRGAAEGCGGRTAAQVAANLGVAALVCCDLTQACLSGCAWFSRMDPALLLAIGLAALAEAAADTVSSEAGMALSLQPGRFWAWTGQPRMITTLRLAAPGTDGAISVAGTLAGVAAAGIVALLGTLALGGGAKMFGASCAGGVFGLLFDSLLGATLERRGWLNNDAVNFLSTASAAGFALGVLAALSGR